QVVTLESWLRGQRIDKVKARLWPERHGDRHRTVQFHYRRRRHLGQFCIEPGDLGPVRLLRGQRSGMTGRNRCLEGIRAMRSSKCLGTFKRSQPPSDEEPIPERPVLIEEQDGLS